MARPVLGSGIGETSRPVTGPTVQDNTGWGGNTGGAFVRHGFSFWVVWEPVGSISFLPS